MKNDMFEQRRMARYFAEHQRERYCSISGYRRMVPEMHPTQDETVITLATTMKLLWPAARTILPANYWKVGKVVRLEAFGKATTDGTAGNYVFEAALGVGDAPAGLAAGATVAGTVSQTNITWTAWAYFECVSMATPATAKFRIWGEWRPAVALLASTLQPYLFPGSAPADITVDASLATSSLGFQLQRSGTGVWTALTTNIIVEEVEG